MVYTFHPSQQTLFIFFKGQILLNTSVQSGPTADIRMSEDQKEKWRGSLIKSVRNINVCLFLSEGENEKTAKLLNFVMSLKVF